MKNLDSEKHFYLITLMIIGGTGTGWLLAFPLKPATEVNVLHLFMQTLIVLLVLVAYKYLFRLNNIKLQLGWGLFAAGKLMELCNELSPAPDLYGTTLKGVLTISGLSLTVWGFYQTYSYFVNRINENKKTQQKLVRMKEIQKCVTEILENIIVEKDRDSLFQKTCGYLVQTRDYRFAWIGLVEENTKKIKPVAHAGFEQGYLKDITVTYDETKTGKGPAGTAIRTLKPAVIKDTQTDPLFKPWRQEAQKRNFKSVLSAPLINDKKAFGSLTVYSAYPNAFDVEEVELINTLARSLSYACHILEVEENEKKARKALKESETHFRILVETLGEGVIVTDLDDNIKYSNPAFCSLLEYSKSDLTGKNLKEFIPPSQWEKLKEHNLLRRKGTSSSYELEITAKSGEIKIVKVTGVPIKDAAGNTRETLGVLTDVTRLKKLENKLLKQAIKDELTGLYNRFYFKERIKKEVERAGRFDHALSFVMIDVDNFKFINDKFSHLEGDKVLQGVGSILKKSTRKYDLAFRYGGDEFLLVLPETSEKQAQVLVERIKNEVEVNFKRNKNLRVKPFLSFGISTWSSSKGKKWEDVLKESDLKMYHEKMKKKNKSV